MRWAPKEGSTYQVRLTAFVDDRQGILKDLTSIVANEGLNIVKIESHNGRRDDQVAIAFVVEVADKLQLDKVESALSDTASVRSVERSSKF